MRHEFRHLRAGQLDRGLDRFRAARDTPRPAKGWIRAIRETVGLSAAELGRVLGVSRQLPLQFEKAEADDSITLGSLRRVAHALDCDLVYALVPRAGSVQQLIERRTLAEAKANVEHVEHSMALEAQAAGGVEQAIEIERARIAGARS